MKGVKEIRSRIKAVQNTAKITRAMQLVASSKMKKAQQLAIFGRPYMLLLTEIADEIAKIGPEHLKHPLFDNREIHNRGILVIGTDKGLCGSLNQNVLKFINANVIGDIPAKYITVGKKATQLLSNAKKNITAHFNVSDRTEYHELSPIIEFVKNAYLAGEIDTLEVVYAKYVNPLVQEPEIQHILPMVDFRVELNKFREMMHVQAVDVIDDERPTIIEPDISSVVAMLSRMFLSQNVYRLLLEAKASEHSARTIAMKGATDNAEELSKQLSLEYNKLRQSAITNEIIEISAAIQGL